MGAVSFANDIKLLTPTFKGLNNLAVFVRNILRSMTLSSMAQKVNIWYIKVEIVWFIMKMFM